MPTLSFVLIECGVLTEISQQSGIHRFRSPATTFLSSFQDRRISRKYLNVVDGVGA